MSGDWVAPAVAVNDDEPLRQKYARLRDAADRSQGAGTPAFQQFAGFHDLLQATPRERWPSLVSEAERRAMAEEAAQGGTP